MKASSISSLNNTGSSIVQDERALINPLDVRVKGVSKNAIIKYGQQRSSLTSGLSLMAFMAAFGYALNPSADHITITLLVLGIILTLGEHLITGSSILSSMSHR